jgi:SAM-dependent methyltransferase
MMEARRKSGQGPASGDDLAAAVEAVSWYHTIELAGGVVTPGYYDTIAAIGRFPFPSSLEGKRCLDVGTSDGFWAFEMERRGAAEVVAIDIDDPSRYDWPHPRPSILSLPANQEPGANKGFRLAHEALGSSVERRDVSVYELAPETVGSFDFVFMGALMLHLRDPVGALTAIRSVVGGEFLSTDSISLWTSISHPGVPAALLDAEGKPRWWTPNLTGYRRMLEAAGFRIESSGGPYFTPFGRGFPPPLGLRELLRRQLVSPREVAFHLVLRRLGAPSGWALCAPLG